MGIRIDTKTKVYILSDHVDTGGPKSLHQLAQALYDKKVEVYLVYVYKSKILNDEKLYKWCCATTVSSIEDNVNNLVICPETSVNILKQYKYVKKVIWWLSLDFYLRKNVHFCTIKKIQLWNLPIVLYPIIYLYYQIKIKDKVYCVKSEFGAHYHLYNCNYVYQYLRRQGIDETKMYYLCGPLDDLYLKDSIDVEKEELIAYGYNRVKVNTYYVNEVIRRVKKNKDIEAIPIVGLSDTQVKEILARAKVYMDLGVFPGPERIPREAVMMECNLLIAKRGAAKNTIDYPIKSDYKCMPTIMNIGKIACKVISMVDNYDEELNDFKEMKGKVIRQKSLFYENIDKIFSLS